MGDITNGSAIAACNAVVDRLDIGTGTATVQIRTGTKPADADAVASGTLLVTFNLPNPAFGNATDQNPNARASLNGVPISASAAATGTAGYYRGLDRNGATVIQGDCSGTGGGGEMELDSTSITSGQTVNLNSWTVTMPE